MKSVRLFLPVLTVLAMVAACNPAQKQATAASECKYALMAGETLDSLYTHFGIAGECLLRENYPHDESYKAGYLAGEDTNEKNPYSYLWPYSGTLSAVRALYDATGDTTYLTLLEERVLPGLNQYYDTLRTPAAYASYVNGAPQSDRFYDDNVWLGIDFTDLYDATGNTAYLDKAKEIWKFIESGTDSLLGGGIYWCEQKKGGKNTCSNAPGSVYALKLFKATSDTAYLDAGRNLYSWTKENLQDTADCLYFDHKLLNGKIGRAKFAYNSGQMLQAATLLYNITGDDRYLTDARDIAASAHSRFFDRSATDSIGEFPRFGRGNVWFMAVMMRGFHELFLADGNPEYMDSFLRNLDYAWATGRDTSTGLFEEDWENATPDKRKWLLTQGAATEMLATAALYSCRSDKH